MSQSKLSERCSSSCVCSGIFDDIRAAFILPSDNQKRGTSLILSLAGRLRCQHAAKSVNHVAIVAVDYVAIGGLHFQTVARCPGAAAQHTPVTTGCAVASF